MDPNDTVFKYQHFFNSFNDVEDADPDTQFETKAIFSLADYLKSLTANEYYDIAARVYSEWQDQENNEITKKLEKLWKLADFGSEQLCRDSFAKWKEMRNFQVL